VTKTFFERPSYPIHIFSNIDGQIEQHVARKYNLTAIGIPDLYRLFRTLVCLLILSLFIPLMADAQDEESAIELTAKGRASLIFFADQGENSFKYAPSGAVGFHIGISKSFGRWAVETGVGVDRMSFVQRVTNFAYSTVEEDITLRMHYFAAQVPVSARYSISEVISVSGGVNFMAANLNAYGISVSSSALGSSGFESTDPGGFPGYQFSTELHAGLRFDVTDRASIALHTGYSLLPISGIDLWFSSQEAEANTKRFEYRWFRAGVELIYRF